MPKPRSRCEAPRRGRDLFFGNNAWLAGSGGAAYPAEMVRRAIAGIFVLAAFGCADAPTYVEFAEVCGEAGPVRVLELAPGEHMGARPWKFGERVVHAIEDSGESAGWRPRTTVWTSGPCGEAPRRVAEVSTVFVSERWPDVLLGCDGAGEQVLALDPEGVAPPNPVFTGLRGCGYSEWTTHGMLSLEPRVEGEDLFAPMGTLRLHRFPADPRRDTGAAVTLLDAMRLWSREGQQLDRMLRIFPGFVLALTEADELVRVDLVDGAVITVQTGVAAFQAGGPDGRYVLWQDLTPTDDEPKFPAGKLFLRDRNDGSDVFLGEGALGYNWDALNYLERGWIVLRLAAGTRLFSFPDLSFVDLPPIGWLDELIDERRALMQWYGIFSVVDLVSGETKKLNRSRGELRRYRADGFELLQVQPFVQPGSQRDEGPLWFIPYEGEASRLSARSTRFGHTFKDGRRADVVGIGGDYRGVLQLADPETDEVLRIEDGVFAGFFAVSKVFPEDVVVYSIPGGERAGVWIARLSAR